MFIIFWRGCQNMFLINISNSNKITIYFVRYSTNLHGRKKTICEFVYVYIDVLYLDVNRNNLSNLFSFLSHTSPWVVTLMNLVDEDNSSVCCVPQCILRSPRVYKLSQTPFEITVDPVLFLVHSFDFHGWGEDCYYTGIIRVSCSLLTWVPFCTDFYVLWWLNSLFVMSKEKKEKKRGEKLMKPKKSWWVFEVIKFCTDK